jgi:hypothetical protein
LDRDKYIGCDGSDGLDNSPERVTAATVKLKKPHGQRDARPATTGSSCSRPSAFAADRDVAADVHSTSCCSGDAVAVVVVVVVAAALSRAAPDRIRSVFTVRMSTRIGDVSVETELHIDREILLLLFLLLLLMYCVKLHIDREICVRRMQ